METMRPRMGEMSCVPCMMPYIDSEFMPRVAGDRPSVISVGATNYCVFTVEYSVRSAQTAVFGLLGLDREVSPIYRGDHDIRVLRNALKALRR